MASDIPPGRAAGPGDGGGPGNWLALVFVLMLAAAGVFVVNAIIKQVGIQNCVLSGRRDCLEIAPAEH